MAAKPSVVSCLATPPDALLRLREIVGQSAVSEEEAERNRLTGKGPKRSRPGIPALVSVSPSTWWSWTAQKIAPTPIRLCGATFWRASDVLNLAARAANDIVGPADDCNTHAPGGTNEAWKQKLRARKGAQA